MRFDTCWIMHQSSYNVPRCSRHFMCLCECADQCSPLKVTFRMFGICKKLTLSLSLHFSAITELERTGEQIICERSLRQQNIGGLPLFLNLSFEEVCQYLT